MGNILLTNSSLLMKQLDQIEPGLKKAVMRDSKKIAMDVANPIKNAIPSRAPLTTRRGPNQGLNSKSRLNYYGGSTKRRSNISPQDVKPVFKASVSKTRNVTSLVKVVAYSPAIAMIDMARRGRTASGRALVRNLRGSASRYVWPAAEKALPQVTADVKNVMNAAGAKLGRKLF